MLVRMMYLDFNSRRVYLRDPTCECCVLNVASDLRFLNPNPAWPDWAEDHKEFQTGLILKDFSIDYLVHPAYRKGN